MPSGVILLHDRSIVWRPWRRTAAMIDTHISTATDIHTASHTAVTPAVMLIILSWWLCSICCQISVSSITLFASSVHVRSPCLTNCWHAVDISGWRLAHSNSCIWIRLRKSRGSMWFARSSIYICMSSWMSRGSWWNGCGWFSWWVWHCPAVQCCNVKLHNTDRHTHVQTLLSDQVTLSEFRQNKHKFSCQ